MNDSPAAISPPPTRRSRFGDDWSYLLPMLAFMAFTEVGVRWPGLFPIAYAVKTVLTAILLWLCWPAFTKIKWTAWNLGIVVGVVGVVQWVAMEKLLLHLWPNYPRMSTAVLDPYAEVANPSLRLVFFTFRWLGPTLIVPFMEELFWRDFLWRTFIAPSDFKLASIGEWDPKAFWLVPLLFASVHIQWITAVVWALMIGLLLLRTKSLGSCIIAHGVTNCLLGAYVLWTHDWYFW
jgi:CAAX prenyl protease-like protein